MNNLLLPIASLALSLVIGSIAFQSFVVAPTVFGSLEERNARVFLRSLFPRFFRVNGVAGLIALLALAGAGAASGWSVFFLWATVGAALIPASMLVSLSLVGEINSARDDGAAGAGRFARLHRITVLLTVLSLLVAMAILLALGATSSGY